MPWINAYRKKDGTEVSAHARSAPGSGRELTALGMVVLIVWAIGSGQVRITDVDGKAAPKPAQVSAPVTSGNGAGR